MAAYGQRETAFSNEEKVLRYTVLLLETTLTIAKELSPGRDLEKRHPIPSYSAQRHFNE